MNDERIVKMFDSSHGCYCFFCKKEMSLDEKLWYIGGMNDMLVHQECYFSKTMNIKDLIKDNIAEFSRYRKGNLYYVIYFEGNHYEFPVPIEDTGDATFEAMDKAIFFMRYIRKAIEDQTLNKITYPQAVQESIKRLEDGKLKDITNQQL